MSFKIFYFLLFLWPLNIVHAFEGNLKIENFYQAKKILNEIPRGVDRIVPVGNAIDMDINWDGYNLIETLSRNIILK